MLKDLPESTKSTPWGARISENFQLSPKGCSDELIEDGKGHENGFKSRFLPTAHFRSTLSPSCGTGKNCHSWDQADNSDLPQESSGLIFNITARKMLLSETTSLDKIT